MGATTVDMVKFFIHALFNLALLVYIKKALIKNNNLFFRYLYLKAFVPVETRTYVLAEFHCIRRA